MTTHDCADHEAHTVVGEAYCEVCGRRASDAPTYRRDPGSPCGYSEAGDGLSRYEREERRAEANGAEL